MASRFDGAGCWCENHNALTTTAMTATATTANNPQPSDTTSRFKKAIRFSAACSQSLLDRQILTLVDHHHRSPPQSGVGRPYSAATTPRRNPSAIHTPPRLVLLGPVLLPTKCNSDITPSCKA